MPFNGSPPLTLGVELEVQLLATTDFELTPAASPLLAHLSGHPHAGSATYEITESMLEVSTGVHREMATLVDELRSIRDDLSRAAARCGVAVSGGGSHPSLCWPCQTISDAPRAQRLSGFYGYLAKQWTVFGQHVNVGCRDGDEAIYLLNALSRYVPQFIALAAASPYSQGTDTLYRRGAGLRHSPHRRAGSGARSIHAGALRAPARHPGGRPHRRAMEALMRAQARHWAEDDELLGW